MNYKRSREGYLLRLVPNGTMEPIQVCMRGFGTHAGAAVLTSVLDLLDGEHGKSVVVNDTNMDGDGKPLHYSLTTGEIIPHDSTNKSLIEESKNGKRGYRIDPEYKAMLRTLPSSRDVSPAPVISNPAMLRQPHETQEAYELRLGRSGFKPRETQEQWAARMRANANDGTLPKGMPEGGVRPNQAKPRPTQEELIVGHRKNAFSAGKEKEPLPIA